MIPQGETVMRFARTPLLRVAVASFGTFIENRGLSPPPCGEGRGWGTTILRDFRPPP